MMKNVFDVIVVGSGQAALSVAITAREQGASVLMITKGRAGKSGSSVISDGVHSAVFSSGDSAETFYEDMIAGGKKLSDPVRARVLVEECTERVKELEEKYGLHIHYEQEVATPGHSYPRRCYVEGGQGRFTTQALADHARLIGVEFVEKARVTDLIKEEGRVIGCQATTGQRMAYFYGRATVLAAGGIGNLYAQTDNPNDVSGECLGMAWRHGAVFTDMEFVQYYPYRLVQPLNMDVFTKIFGKGAIMRNEAGERFMENYPKKELETRDVICLEMKKQQKVLLDLTEVSKKDLLDSSPRLARLVEKENGAELIVSPVEHYLIGGIKVDEFGRTGIQGLFACGECTGGLHGANRLGGGSLTEALVFGRRTGLEAVNSAEHTDLILPDNGDVSAEVDALSPDVKQAMATVKQQVQEIMWNKVGIERTESSIEEAKKELDTLIDRVQSDQYSLPGIHKQVVLDMVRAAWLTTYSASIRKESRGAHQVMEYESENLEWEGNIEISGTGWTLAKSSTERV